MKYFLWIIIAAFSCSERVSNEIYQGKLDELIVGDFVLEKDLETQYLHNIQTFRDMGKEFFYYKNSSSKNKSTTLKIHDADTGISVRQVSIPWEGPNALRNNLYDIFPFEMDRLFAISFVGQVGEYDSLGMQRSAINSDLGLSRDRADFVKMEARKGLINFADGWLQIGQNPSNSLMSDPKARLMESRFPVTFSRWLSWINVETGEVRHSDFKAPEGYSEFEKDATSTFLFGAYDTKRRFYYLGFPYSDSIYKLADQEMKEVLKLESGVGYNFIPSEVIPWGDNFTVWALPKEASMHIFLLYDPHHDLFVRASKINESGTGETKFRRTKHYVLSIYSGEWEPKGEYFFDYKGEMDLENWFLTSQSLFLSKPKQPNEDEYEFYRVDLSKFAGK